MAQKIKNLGDLLDYINSKLNDDPIAPSLTRSSSVNLLTERNDRKLYDHCDVITRVNNDDSELVLFID